MGPDAQAAGSPGPSPRGNTHTLFDKSASVKARREVHIRLVIHNDAFIKGSTVQYESGVDHKQHMKTGVTRFTLAYSEAY